MPLCLRLAARILLQAWLLQERSMRMRYREIGVCGLSCRLCPSYHAQTQSRCSGCKGEQRMFVGCPFITCAVKRKGLEFCWDCEENATCVRWKKHRGFGRRHDTFVCYQKLEDNISAILKRGVAEFEKNQKVRERLLKDALDTFNEGRSKTYYSVAATVLEVDELKRALAQAAKDSSGLGVRGRSRVLHSILDQIAQRNGYCLKLRRP